MSLARSYPPLLLTIYLSLTFLNATKATNLETIIQPTFGGAPLLLDSLRYETSAKETLSFTRISFLLCGFALEKEKRWKKF